MGIKKDFFRNADFRRIINFMKFDLGMLYTNTYLYYVSLFIISQFVTWGKILIPIQ